ncbi:hypothetical protein sos41_40370 [Alphaproteobacteria bacterium SO-S41]|nr:hypothetical protein sos41_40370 [Alphaproteobacteria bacterium SO-S41]
MKDYRVTVQVTPDGEARAIAKIQSRFDIPASQVERQKTLLSAIYHQVVHSIIPAR